MTPTDPDAVARERAAGFAEWYRFTGIAGLKRYMSGASIESATKRGFGWVRWYEPVCSTCPALRAIERGEHLERGPTRQEDAVLRSALRQSVKVREHLERGS